MSMITSPTESLADVIAEAGTHESLRRSIFEALRQAEKEASDPGVFRDTIRWPMISALLQKVGFHRVTLSNGLVFDVGPVSRIERALLLSRNEIPDHVWEPQTTKLLTGLAIGVQNVIVGGAYIGDQVLHVAKALTEHGGAGVVHAFEPMDSVFRRFTGHIQLNQVSNVRAHRMCLWGRSGLRLKVEGAAALASSAPADLPTSITVETAESITIDDYSVSLKLPSVGLIMLDTEGGEHQALLGATALLSRPFPEAPNVIFEVHRSFVDWSNGLEKTPIVELLTSKGYNVVAIRDFQDNYSMAGRPVEIIPVNCVHLDGPPHGFNLLATKDPGLVQPQALGA
jgi:FkbM family methyltransferase